MRGDVKRQRQQKSELRLAPDWLTCRANAAVDASEAAQLMAIDKTFTDLHAQPVEDIQHPDGKKRALKVVEVGASPAL